MIYENEIIMFMLGLGVLVFVVLNYFHLKRIPLFSVLLVGFCLLVVGWGLTVLEGFFPEQERGYSLCKGGLYKHALGAAVTAERLAKTTKCVSADVAYTAGLLHDIGKVVLDQFVAPALPLFYRRTQEDGTGLIEVEQEVIGISHTEVGGRLGEQWSFPAALIEAIRNHHEPEKATVNRELAHVVHLADLFMSRFATGQELEQINTDLLAQRLAKIGLSAKEFPKIVDTISREVFGKGRSSLWRVEEPA